MNSRIMSAAHKACAPVDHAALFLVNILRSDGENHYLVALGSAQAVDAGH